MKTIKMKKQNKIDTILFDFDGTLVNTIPLIIHSFEATLQHFLPEQTFTMEQIHDFIGPTLVDTFGSLMPEKTDEMIRYYREHNVKYHNEMVELYPYVKEDLEALKQAGYTLGIVSSKQRIAINWGLDQFDLHHLFDVIISSDDVTNSKPDPEPIDRALEQLNKTREQAIFVGDTAHDIHCGVNIDMYTCGVAWSFRGANYLKEQGANCILERVSDLLTVIKDV